ncbi:MAG: DUF5667 domain-containing protein [Bacillota bacterium]
MLKKFIAVFLIIILTVPVYVFADETGQTAPTDAPQNTEAVEVTVESTTEVKPGITPDSPFYGLDKLLEGIQLLIITDALKEAEVLAKQAEERLAESKAMLEKNDLELSKAALEEYKTTMTKATESIEKAVEDGKSVGAAAELIKKTTDLDNETLAKVVEKMPEEYKAQVEQAIANINLNAEAAEDVSELDKEEEQKEEEEEKNQEEQIKQQVANEIIAKKINDAALSARIAELQLNTRQAAALLSLAEQAERPLSEVIEMFAANGKGIGSTAQLLGLQPREALKGVNNTFKALKKEVKNEFENVLKDVEEEKNQAEAALESMLKEIESEDKDNEKDEAKYEEKKLKMEKKALEKAIEKEKKAAEKAFEKAEKEAEKALEKFEKEAEKKVKGKKDKREKPDRDDDEEEDDDDDDDEDDEEDDDEEDNK